LTSDVDIGRLLTLAVDVTAVPGSTGVAAEYHRLVLRYLADAPFRAAFRGVLEGAGLSVETAGEHVGIVLRADPDSPWAWPRRTADLPWNAFSGASERASRALVVVALLAYVAPAAADLDELLSDPAAVLPAVAVRDLEQFVRGFCEQREADSPDPGGDPDSRPLWWHWLQLPPEKPGTRTGPKTTVGVVFGVLQFLHEQGWLVDTTPARGGADKRYRPRRRLLHHHRDLLVDPVFLALRQHAGGQGS
jgi:hypothetical protein